MWTAIILALISASMSASSISASEDSCLLRAGSLDALPAALEFLDNNQDEAQQDVLQLVRFPSISSMPQYKESVREAGQWLVRRMRRAGLEVLP